MSNSNNMFESWYDELQSAYLYKQMAEVETHPDRKKMFLKLGEAAIGQSQLWKQKAQSQNIDTQSWRFKPTFRAGLVSVLIKWVGPKRIKTLLAAMKVRGISVYQEDFPVDHHESHTSTGDNAAVGQLRAIVFGFSDGLVSNASLMMGVLGAGVDHSQGLVTGVAGLLAGAFSMASGEYISVKSQRELYEYQMALESEELKTYPQEEAQELALIYEAKGIDKKLAVEMGNKIVQNPSKALATLAREELGLNPDDLGSPLGAAGASFLSFALGAIVPLIPFFMGTLDSQTRMNALIVLSLVSLYGVGAVLSLFSGRSAVKGGLRLVAVGTAAASLTFLIGKLWGVALT